jgi:hypothetical protein
LWNRYKGARLLKSWKLTGVFAGSIALSTILYAVIEKVGDSWIGNALFYLQYPGFFCSLLTFGVHGDGGHWFGAITILVNAVCYFLIVIVLLRMISRKALGDPSSAN